MLNKEQWLNKLLEITPVRNAGLMEWESIQSGTSNFMFKVSTQAGVWMVRFNRAALGIDRNEELKIMNQVEAIGIGPKVIEINPQAGYLITEYIEHHPWTPQDFNDPEKLQQLSDILNRIHTVPYEYLPSRLDHRLKLYLKTIKKVPVNTTMVLLDTIQKLDFLGFWKANNTLYHSDLNPNNLLNNGSKTTVIDWEFAGQGHPLLDWLILEHETQVDCSAFYPEDINPVWVDPAQRMIKAMMNLWPHESP